MLEDHYKEVNAKPPILKNSKMYIDKCVNIKYKIAHVHVVCSEVKVRERAVVFLSKPSFFHTTFFPTDYCCEKYIVGL